MSTPSADFNPFFRAMARKLGCAWEELHFDRALQLFGAALCCCYLLTAFYWLDVGIDALIVPHDPWCWPFFDSCYKWRLPRSVILSLVMFIALGALIGASLFVLPRSTLGMWVLSVLFLMTVIVVVQDFRFRANQVYMLSWVTVVFLFVPLRRIALKVLIVSFYFWAGLLKLNKEWLSGAVLYSDLWLIPKGFEVPACWFVVLLEVVLVWGLLSGRPKVFWSSLLLLLVFHIESFSQVVYWYPLLMFLLLSIFLLTRFFPIPPILERKFTAAHHRYTGIAVFLVFGFFQLLPRMASVDSTLDGTLRHVALHMFQARQQCLITVTKNYSDGRAEKLTPELLLTPRMKCEPIIYLNWARNRCLEWLSDPRFTSVTVVMDVKRTTEVSFTRVIDQRIQCN